jgi:hypothetical protein
MTIGIIDGNGGCFGIVVAGGSSFLASLAVIVVSARESKGRTSAFKGAMIADPRENLLDWLRYAMQWNIWRNTCCGPSSA